MKMAVPTGPGHEPRGSPWCVLQAKGRQTISLGSSPLKHRQFSRSRSSLTTDGMKERPGVRKISTS